MGAEGGSCCSLVPTAPVLSLIAGVVLLDSQVLVRFWHAAPVSLKLKHPFISVENGSLNNWCWLDEEALHGIINASCLSKGISSQVIQEGGTGGQNSTSESVPKDAHPGHSFKMACEQEQSEMTRNPK